MAVPIDFTGQRLPKSVLCLLSCRNKKVRRTPGMLQLSIRTKDCLYRYPMFLPGNGGMLPLSFSHGRRPLLFPDVFCPVTKHVLIPMFLTQERYRAVPRRSNDTQSTVHALTPRAPRRIDTGGTPAINTNLAKPAKSTTHLN